MVEFKLYSDMQHACLESIVQVVGQHHLSVSFYPLANQLGPVVATSWGIVVPARGIVIPSWAPSPKRVDSTVSGIRTDHDVD